MLTGDPSFVQPGIHVARDWDGALALAADLGGMSKPAETMIVGGAAIYALALPSAERLHLTLVHAEPEGEVRFPPFDRTAFRETHREAHPAGPDDEHAFTFVDLERRPAAGDS